MNLYLVLTQTPPDRYQPDGGVILCGLFHNEEELATLPPGNHIVFVGERENEGTVPLEFHPIEKRDTTYIKPRVKVQKLV